MSVVANVPIPLLPLAPPTSPGDPLSPPPTLDATTDDPVTRCPACGVDMEGHDTTHCENASCMWRWCQSCGVLVAWPRKFYLTPKGKGVQG